MSKDDEEFDIKFGDIFQKCDNDADKVNFADAVD